MKTLLIVALALALTTPVFAIDLGGRSPDKPVVQYAPGTPDPDVLRQGGDTVMDAVPLSFPTIDMAGTTVGYTDDYDEVCPYTDSTSPDVVYSLTSDEFIRINLDTFGSAYDTKIYVYDEDLELMLCNDDFYPDYTSRIENLVVDAGATVYIVIDGYGGDSGEYLLNITEFDPCVIDCNPSYSWQYEGEPPLAVDYEDVYNSGCGGPTGTEFLTWDTREFCGRSGWYPNQGAAYRDTDWFLIPIPDAGYIEIEGDARRETYMFELAPQDCNSVAVVQQAVIGPCLPGVLTITGEPGTDVWFWVGPTSFESPEGLEVEEYSYVLFNLTLPVAVESHRLSEVRELFR